MRGIQVAQYVKVSPYFIVNDIFPLHDSYIISTQGPKELKVTELPDPTPAADEYLIEVHAAATNFFDILQIQGKYQHQPRKASFLAPGLHSNSYANHML